MNQTLAGYRISAGYKTQRELAEQLGVGCNTLSRWETGQRIPNISMIFKLANLLKTTEGEIIEAITAAKSKCV